MRPAATRSAGRLLRAACLFLVAGAACRDDETALVIEVVSVVPASALDSVSIHVGGPGLPPEGRTAVTSLNGAGTDPKRFPLRLRLIHGGAALGPLVLSVEGRLQGELRARVAGPPPLYFESGRVITHRFVLEEARGGGTGQPGTSGAPDARPNDAIPSDGPGATSDPPARPGDSGPTPPPSTLPPPSPSNPPPPPPPPPPPAPTPPPPSPPPPAPPAPTPPPPPPAPPPPAPPPPPPAPPGTCGPGCACEQTCTDKETCGCTGGCGCAFTCKKDKDCTVDCRGAATTCLVRAAKVSNGRVTCAAGARCNVSAEGEASNLDVICQSAECEIDCTGEVSNCRVLCTASARCLLHCAGASNCSFEPCEGAQTRCGTSSMACNRSCP